MPYIRLSRREVLDPLLEPLAAHIEDEGELNYAFTVLAKRFLPAGARYANLNTAMGVFLCAALEFYREDVVPYEDVKMKENGRVL
jgi:hypothetical protein